MAKDKIEDVLGAGEEDESQEANPLEKMDKVSKATPDGGKGKQDTSLDENIVKDMFKTGDNVEGMFTPNDESEFEKEDKDAKVSVGKNVKPSEKYEKQFKDDMLKHPDEYKVMTPRGEMTVAEAIKAGFNPITKRFEKGHGQEAIRNKHLAGLNDADKKALTKLTDPANAQVAPADAEMYGLKPGSPMIRPQEAANPTPGMNPMMPPTGVAPTGGVPLGGAMPGAEESTAPGGMDLNALLGGGQ